ncbi:unnamed protein product [Meloidogyne enterolobii]|uniref:Uncharacterized protein n=1 Tax=Meloidogyne enterolobii TaxID=390850 RepID=A0ACB0ZYZ4_MELEN
MPFVYSVNNKVIEKLNKGLNAGSEKTCKKSCKACMPWTSLEVSWSRSKSGTYAYAHIHLIGEAKRGLSPEKELNDSEMTFDLEITAEDKFTMHFSGRHEFDPKGQPACLAKKSKIRKPEAWSIMNKELHELHGKHLLVFSLLSRNATFVFDGAEITDEKPSVPYCELFVRFNRPDYDLLYVNPPQPATTTTTTTKVTSTGTKTTPETSTFAPCPTSAALMTTTAAKNISSPSTKYPAESKCPEKSNLWLYVIVIAVGVIIIGILAWFTWNWVEVNSEKRAARAAKRAKDREWYADYQAEAKLKGSENMKPFEIWKDDQKLDHNKKFLDRHPIEQLGAAMWRKAEKEKDDKSKMQFIVDQIVRLKDKELYDNEYSPELAEKGYENVGEFEEWKKKKYINTFAVVETEIEYEKPDNVGKELLPGASSEDKKKARR